MVYRYLQSPVVQGYFKRETRAVAQPTLNVSLIKKTPIAIPPKRLQAEYLKRQSNILIFKSNLKKALDLDNSMFNSLSQQAFAGKL